MRRAIRSPMHTLRHCLARGARRCCAPLLGVLLLACPPGESEALIARQTAALHSGAVHVTVRANRECLAATRDELVLFAAATGARSVVLLPDDPSQPGVSVGGNAASVGLRGLRAACAAGGSRELALTVLVESSPAAGSTAPTEVALTVRVTATEATFAAAAHLELQVDGEPVVVAVRQPFP